MPSIGSNSKPAYVYDAGTDTWIPIGPGEHTHEYIGKDVTTTTGDIIYASGANTPARLGIGSTDQILKVTGGVPVWATPSSGTPTFSGVTATGTSAQSISNATETVLTFNSEVYDTDSYHSTSSNTSRLTIPTGKSGYYLITFMVQYAVNGTDGHRTVYIKKNGSVYLHGGASSRPSSTVFTAISYTMIHNLTAGDYIELATYQNSGGALNVIKATTPPDTYFTMQYLGA